MVLPQDFHGDDIYIETHLGGGAIMQRKAPARHNIGIDRAGSFRCLIIGLAPSIILRMASAFIVNSLFIRR